MTVALSCFTVGLLTSLHCLGMCGGFAFTLGQAGAREAHPAQRWLRQAAYHGGRIFTYAFLGMLCGALGRRVTGVEEAGVVLACVAGAAMVWIGLELLGVLRARSFELLRPLALLSSWMRAFLGRRGLTAPFLVGLANGFLPCGAILAMLAVAMAQGRAVGGALAMIGFGLGTAPALLVVSLGGERLTSIWRARLARLGGAAVVLLGCVTLWRTGLFTSAVGAACHVVE